MELISPSRVSVVCEADYPWPLSTDSPLSVIERFNEQSDNLEEAYQKASDAASKGDNKEMVITIVMMGSAFTIAFLSLILGFIVVQGRFFSGDEVPAVVEGTPQPDSLYTLPGSNR